MQMVDSLDSDYLMSIRLVMQPPKAHFLTFSSETKIMKITLHSELPK